jgi:hypothetical protein
MKRILFLALVLISVSCRKDRIGADYNQLIGKYKLIYTYRFSATTYDKILPSDNYEIDFNKNGKVYKIKDGDCEAKEKVEDCMIVNDSPPSQNRNVFLYLKKQSGAIQMEFQHYSNGNDTLLVTSFYPFENDPNQNPYRYEHYYVKE